jgi:hypothetical protein
MRRTLVWFALSVTVTGWAQTPPSTPQLPLSIPFEFANNQAYVKVAINGSQPQWFVVDTGAGACVIDTTVAKRLGLQTSGHKEGSGAGKGTYAVTFAKNVTYNLSGMNLPVESSYVIDLSGQPEVIGREIAGILGYDFFVPYVVEIDYEAAVLTLRDPKTFHYAGEGETIPFTLVKNTPHIRAKVAVAEHQAQERELLVDSGSEDGLDDDLLAQSPQRLEVIGGVGLGKEFRTTLGRADSLQMGRFMLTGPFGATGGVALIGTEVLRRFNIFFDYSRSQMIVEPNAHLSDPFVMDASGLDLRWAKNGFVVHDVASNSAAGDAGLKTGDTIVEINGQVAPAFTMQQVGKLMTEAGHTLLLTIRRDDRISYISIALRKRL